MMDDRGVSDLVAFVMIFAVMVASVGAIAIFGWDAVEDVRDQEQLNSAQAGFITLNDQLNGIADHEAPARATEFRLGGATLAVTDGPNISVQVRENDTLTTTIEGRLGALQFRQDDQHVTTAAGAVFRGDESGSVMLTEPPFQCRPDAARINLISAGADDVALIDSVATVQVQSRHERTNMRIPSNWSHLETAREVSVTVVDSPNQEAWERYFEDANWTAGEAPGEFVCTPTSETMRAMVRSTRIEFRFIR